VEPTEGLNEPPIFLGILRLLGSNEGQAFGSPEITAGLRRVEEEVRGRVQTRMHLVRADPKRNLFRNAQQYWKALGLLASAGGVELTPFGRAVADGRIARDEFATTVVKTLELPNPSVEPPEEVREWEAYRLRIKPLELILTVMRDLGREGGAENAYLTRDELTSVVIPLAGDRRSTPDEYVSSITRFRAEKLNLNAWPDCVPGDNDARMAGEFLRFLAFYGFCSFEGDSLTRRTKLYLDMNQAGELSSLLLLRPNRDEGGLAVVNELRQAQGIDFVERQRVTREVLLRPKQARFRSAVLAAYQSTCLLTGERIPQVLEAAHIIPVEHRGDDTRDNGLCLRSDIHSLYDTGHIRMSQIGALTFSDAILASQNYRHLPRQVTLPPFLRRKFLEWRYNYQ
jgi:hypothetical protein